MKIYTRTGDEGDTGLFGGGRVPKHDPRVEAYGSVDELNAVLGWCVAISDDDPVSERLSLLQHDLFAIGAELATPPAREGRTRPDVPPLPKGRVEAMERWMDEATAELPELRAFVLPGGTQLAAALHVARTACRRAERAATRLAETDEVASEVLVYLNRLSDLLFTLARTANHRAGRADVEWEQSGDDGEG